MFAMALVAAEAKAQNSGESLPNLEAPVEPLRPKVTENLVLTELAAHNEQRRSALHNYNVLRTYQVSDLKGKVHAEEVGRMEFLAPDKKTFTVTSESGSGLVRNMALNPLIKSEIETATGREHHDSAISADNYSLNLLGEQQVGPYRCFVAEVSPKRKDKYLFEGKLWIDVFRGMAFRSAPPSNFWIQRADFVRRYQKIDGSRFRRWTRHWGRLHGKKIRTIDHRDYVANAGQTKDARAIVPEAAIALTSSR